MDSCKQRLGHAKFIELVDMENTVANEIIDCHLSKKKRKLTSEQSQKVFEAFQNLKRPLYLKLVLDEVSNNVQDLLYG